MGQERIPKHPIVYFMLIDVLVDAYRIFGRDFAILVIATKRLVLY